MNRLALTGICKQYPGCMANDGVELIVRQGEIHALLGENGAGKSTLMKIIYGVVKPDAGEFLWEGKPITVSGPSHARRLGIGMVWYSNIFHYLKPLPLLKTLPLVCQKNKAEIWQH